MGAKNRPQIKFYKDAVPDIVLGNKTLEPRPRNLKWINRIMEANEVDFTFGPRFGVPKIFATAQILKVEIRPFETTTKEDLIRIALEWQNKTPEEFIKTYNSWFAKDLAKGYAVAWIYFKLKEKYE